MLEQLELCAEMLEKAERFELLGHLYRLIVPMYEEKRNYEALANCYTHLAQACNKIVEVTKSGKRLLGRFYRIAFFGSVSIVPKNLPRVLLFLVRILVYIYIYSLFYLYYLYYSRHISRKKMAKSIYTKNLK